MKSVTCGGEALDEKQVMAIERIVDQFREKKQITRELRGRKMDFKYLFRVCMCMFVCLVGICDDNGSNHELSGGSGGRSAVAVGVNVVDCCV